MPTVFIIQENPQQDFTDAKKFGVLEVIILGQSKDFQRSLQTVRKVLQTKWRQGDFLLANGDPGHIVGSGLALAKLAISSFNLLKWDRRTLTYKLEQIDL